MADPAQRFLLDCSILCNDSTNENGVEIGDPTETALINLGSRYGVEAAEVRESYPREKTLNCHLITTEKTVIIRIR